MLDDSKVTIQKQSEKDELLKYIEVYNTSRDENEITSILEKYYALFKAELEQRRQTNLELLESYPYCYADSMTFTEALPVWIDEQEVICFLPLEKRFSRFQRLNLNRETLPRNTSIAVAAQFWTADLEDYEKRTALTPESRYLDLDIPMYLIYTPEEWAVFLQIADVKLLLEPKRIVFLVGMDNVTSFFQENGVIFPQQIHGTSHTSEYNSTINRLSQDKVSQFEADIKEIQEYYSRSELEINLRFLESKPRILFITTIFSTAIQYHIRDCMAASKRLGYETALLIEKDPLHRVDNLFEARLVAEFKPDATFMIDHFRFERNPVIFPQKMIFIAWVQDALPHICDPTTPKKLQKNDYIMNHFITWKKFWNLGYDKMLVIDAPVPSNPYIYHPYDLTEEDIKQYGADICMVCHAADVDGCMMGMVSRFNEKDRPMITALYGEYHRLALKEVIYYEVEKFREFIEKYLARQYRVSISDNLKNLIAEHMCIYYNQAVLRQVIADWLIRAGLKNIKLWGNGWLHYKKYEGYAMGPAQNGEVLSKICQASKIVLGNNIVTTGAARAWESMLSGAFYMSNYIPPEADWTDIRKIIKPGDEMVMFYNRKDLIKKVRYYLKHDDERREMARRGREVALQKMTYDALMKRVIGFIGDKLKERREVHSPIES